MAPPGSSKQEVHDIKTAAIRNCQVKPTINYVSNRPGKSDRQRVLCPKGQLHLYHHASLAGVFVWVELKDDDDDATVFDVGYALVWHRQ